MLDLMRQIMTGALSPVMSAAIITGLRVKKETIGEITAAATVLRDMAVKVKVPPPNDNFIDIVGTGGDGSHTFNISTTSSFVIAASGARVAKHGNRGVSSKSGSADAIEALGATLDLSAEQVAASIADTGLGFMFAPNFHAAMRNIAPVRREMGVRTLFNILGPLINPADAPNMLLGVFHADLVGILVRAMERLGGKHVLVVHGLDGVDEISLGAPTMVGELKDGKLSEYIIHPEDFGIRMAGTRNLKVESTEQSIAMMRSVLDNQPGPARDIVVFNSGVALYAANMVETIAEGIASANNALDSGAAKAKMEEFVRYNRLQAGNESQ
ncbi:MAG: anthranilate phosphoribosyltransferase [Betaproteobacteria bacterium]|nr:anthranilate phosphoribosyltransferase [Betaproteobacteria bacterium]